MLDDVKLRASPEFLQRKVTWDDMLNTVTPTLSRGVQELINKFILESSRIGELERRIAELEARPSISYQGTFNEGQSYRAGDACTHRGSLWVARSDTSIKPGDPGSGFQLAVKRPRHETQGQPYA